MERMRKLGVATVVALSIGVVFGASLRAVAGPGQGTLDVAGTWQTSWGSNRSTVVLQQSGPWVNGTFTSTASPPGALAGRLDGNVLTGRWTDATSSGGFRLVFAPSGRSFTGTWGASLDSVDSGGDWSGSR